MLYVSVELEPGHCPGGRFLTRLLIYSESLKKLWCKATQGNAALLSSFPFPFDFLSPVFLPLPPTPAGRRSDNRQRAGAECPGAEESAALRPSPPRRECRRWLEVSSLRRTRSCFLSSACLPALPCSLSRAGLLAHLLCLLFPPPPFSLRLSSVLADCRALSSQMDSVLGEKTEVAKIF